MITPGKINKLYAHLNRADLETQRDILLLVVEEHLCRTILEKISQVARFEENIGAGIAFQIDVEDAVGV